MSRTLLDSIEYRQLNLLDATAIAELSRFDLILCRNVLIYAEATLVRVTNALAGALHTSASESLVRFGTKLRCGMRPIHPGEILREEFLAALES